MIVAGFYRLTAGGGDSFLKSSCVPETVKNQGFGKLKSFLLQFHFSGRLCQSAESSNFLKEPGGRGRQEVRWRRAANPSLSRDCMTHNETKMKTHIYMGHAHTD